jgi:hypothetical protein
LSIYRNYCDRTIFSHNIRINEMSNYEKTLEIIFGRWRSQILYAGVRLGVFDCVRSVPKSSIDIAKELNLDDTLAYRLLRALGSLGLLIEDGNHDF